MGGGFVPHMGVQVQGDKALMGGTHEGGHRPNGGGPKVLLLLSCNYMMEFIGYDSIKTH